MMMVYRGKYIWTVVLILITKTQNGEMSSAFGQGLNITQQSGDETDIFHNSTSQNASSKHNATLAPTNSSKVKGNMTSNDRDCLQSESPYPCLTEKFTAEAVFLMSIAICLGLWTVVANSLPLIAIIRQERLHKPVYILMANLAASDVLTGISFVLVGSTLLLLDETATISESSKVIVRLRFTSVLLSGFSSAYGLVALTAERYWFIVHGMSYVNNVTNDKCKVAIVIVWVWSVLLATLPNFDWNCADSSDEICVRAGLSYSFVIVVLVCVFIPMAAILFFNMGVLRCVWKQVNAIAAQEASVGARRTTNRRSAITIVLITILFLAGWLPIYVRMALFTNDVGWLHKMLIFIILNSALNPVIYGFRLPDIRRGVAGLFVKRRRGHF